MCLFGFNKHTSNKYVLPVNLKYLIYLLIVNILNIKLTLHINYYQCN